MPEPLPFTRLIHADWSKSRQKRWAATASKFNGEWLASPPVLVGDTAGFLDGMFDGDQPTLAGFDFPIGLPAHYGRKTGFKNFPQALEAFGGGNWSSFYDVAEVKEQITLHRPFYPQRPSAATKQAHLLDALELTVDQLLRRCEWSTDLRGAASPLFWTVGAKQVGEAAVSGWRDRYPGKTARGRKTLPFDGSLADLVRENGLILAETYPAEEIFHILMLRFRQTRASKRAPERSTGGDGECGRMETPKPCRFCRRAS